MQTLNENLNSMLATTIDVHKQIYTGDLLNIQKSETKRINIITDILGGILDDILFSKV